MARKPATNNESAPAAEEEVLVSPEAPTEVEPIAESSEDTPAPVVMEEAEEPITPEQPKEPEQPIVPAPVEPVEIDDLSISEEDMASIAEGELNKGLVQATIDSLPRDDKELLMAAIADFQKSGLPRDTIASIILNTFFDKVTAQDPETKETLVAINDRIVAVSHQETFQSFIGELEGILSSGLESDSKLSVLSGAIDTLAGKLG